jgi:glycosyltransferase involved in cell wall biosynthesis
MKLNFTAPINNTGYGIASFNILKALISTHPVDVSFFPIGSPSVSSKEEYDLLSGLIQNRYMCDTSAAYIKIWHQFDLLEHIGRGKYFAMPFFELDTLSLIEKTSLSVPDHLFVTSQWAKNILLNNGVKSTIDIVPLGVDRQIFNLDNYSSNKDPSKYIFLNIGKWEIRKGHDILLELFEKAFPTETDVELHILASEQTNSYSSADELKSWKNLYNKPRIKLYNGVNTHKDVAQIIANSDCGLYPSRAEGWNMELLETMSMNRPVIATNYSSHTEFCNNNNAFLIDIAHTEKAIDGKAFVGQGNWAKIGQSEKNQIIDHMRYCYKNRLSTNIEGVKTAKQYSWINSSNIIYGCIQK